MLRLLTVAAKEIIDNMRDRRTVLWALLFGPLFGPLMFAGITAQEINRSVEASQQPLDLPVAGGRHAPNLVAYLEQNLVNVQDAPANPQNAVLLGHHDVVLVIHETFAEQFRDGYPATVQIVFDQSDTHALREIARLRLTLAAYDAHLAALRLQARGVSSQVSRPLLIEDIDVSTPTGRSVVILGMMTYFLLFAMLIGGMYLAIDATAGERERGSLEPLLTVPMPRYQLILGKIIATCVYMLASLLITVLLFSLLLRFVPLDALGMNVDFGGKAALTTALIMSPFILVGAGLMTVVASFTRSYKEAQTWLSVILLVPTLPILLATIQSLKPTLQLMTIPSLSQHLLVTQVIKGEPVEPVWLAVSSISTVALGLLLIWFATVLYRREALLG